MNSRFPVTLAASFVVSLAGAHPGHAQAPGAIPRTLDVYVVQCGLLSSEGLREGANPRLSLTNCKLSVTGSDNGSTEFELTGTLYGQRITWSFAGDAKANVYKQVSPQTGGKFNRSVTNGVACFVPFDEEGLDDVTSLVCYKRSTLRKVHGWDRGSGAKFPIP